MTRSLGDLSRESRIRCLVGCLCAAGLALGACGVPLQPSAQPIPREVLPAPVATAVPADATPEPGSTEPASVPSDDESVAAAPRLRLWFVESGGLTAVESELPVATGADAVIAALAAGPSDEQSNAGLRTIAADSLTGRPLASLVPLDPSAMAFPADDSVITLQLSPEFTALLPRDQVLLLGQLVLSLTGTGVTAVSFVDSSGVALAVPLPDGRVLDTPARAGDYGPLIYRP